MSVLAQEAGIVWGPIRVIVTDFAEGFEFARLRNGIIVAYIPRPILINYDDGMNLFSQFRSESADKTHQKGQGRPSCLYIHRPSSTRCIYTPKMPGYGRYWHGADRRWGHILHAI